MGTFHRPVSCLMSFALLFVLPVVGAMASEDHDGSANEATATEEEQETTTGTTATAAAAHDRIILNNGEVHDGAFKGLRGGKYRLESEGFGDLAVEPAKVARIELPEFRTMHVKAGKRESAVEAHFASINGVLWMEPVDELPRRFSPDDYMLVQLTPIPYDEWHFRAQATMTFTAGNSETLGSGLITRLRRTTDFDHLQFEYEFGYQESRSGVASVTERFHRGQVGYRYFVAPWWGAFARSTLRSNLLSGITFQNANEVGVSFNPSVRDDLSMNIDIGLTLTYRDRVGQDSEFYGGASASLHLVWKASDTLELAFFNNFDISLDDSANWNNNMRLTGDFMVTDIFSAGFVTEMAYSNQPAANFRNTDFRFVATLGILL